LVNLKNLNPRICVSGSRSFQGVVKDANKKWSSPRADDEPMLSRLVVVYRGKARSNLSSQSTTSTE